MKKILEGILLVCGVINMSLFIFLRKGGVELVRKYVEKN